MARLAPRDTSDLAAIVADAVAREEPLELISGGSKRGLGRPLQLPNVLDLSGFAGISAYEPAELVLTAGAATPMRDIEAALDTHRQMLAFEPGDWRALLGSGGTEPTLAASSPATSPARAASARAPRAIISSAFTASAAEARRSRRAQGGQECHRL